MRRYLNRILTQPLALLALGLAGCETTSNANKALNATDIPIVITKGMSADELKAALGDPDDISPFKDNEGAEVWTYRKIDKTVDMVVTGTKDVPYVDPFTGEQKMLQESVLNPETRTTETETKFLVVFGKVAAWNTNQKSSRHITE